MDGQWELLTDNRLDEDPEYVQAARGAVNAFASSMIRSSTEIVLAVDESGTVVMTTDESAIPSGSRPEAGNIEAGIDGLWSDSVMLGDRRRVAYIESFPPWGWTLYVTEAWDSFYSSVTRIALLIGLIGAISLTIALAFLVIATGVVARPLEGMVKAIETIINTMDLKTRVPIMYKDETGRLAHSFNLMTESLEKANKDIKNFALRAVFAHRRAVLAQKDAEDSREREQSLRVMFQKYVPQSVIDQNIKRKGQNLRVGESQFVSVLMSDIRNFTTITEKMQPAELVNSLNRYFELMVDVIDENGGITDKYIGDAIMALFGAPEKKEDDVWRSVVTAIGLLDALDLFNKEQKIRKSKTFSIGIGIHYGIVTAGNIGSDKKMEYTVIGETVNLASRLEGLTKYYGTPLIVSETVKRRIEKKASTRLLDRALVKGSNLPMPIYTVSLNLTGAKKAVWDAFTAGQQKYYDRDFPGARKAFQDALKAYPNDEPTRIYLERTIELIKNPPPDDWTGEFRHDSK